MRVSQQNRWGGNCRERERKSVVLQGGNLTAQIGARSTEVFKYLIPKWQGGLATGCQVVLNGNDSVKVLWKV